jgi:hypothetical protein
MPARPSSIHKTLRPPQNITKPSVCDPHSIIAVWSMVDRALDEVLDAPFSDKAKVKKIVVRDPKMKVRSIEDMVLFFGHKEGYPY